MTLDFDSTYVFSRSTRRQGVDRTYKRGYALHPMLCFEASSGVAIHARLRRGKAGPSSGIGTFVRETLRRVTRGSDRAQPARLWVLLGRALRTARAGRRHLSLRRPDDPGAARDRHEDCRPAAGLRASTRTKARWPSSAIGCATSGARFRRYIVKRIALDEGQQLSFDGGAYRYWIFVTNDHERQCRRPRVRTPAQGRRRVGHARTQVELRTARLPQARVHGQLGLAAPRLPRPQLVLLDPAARTPRGWSRR